MKIKLVRTVSTISSRIAEVNLLKVAKSDIANTIVLSSVISPPISSVVFVAMLVTWLETVMNVNEAVMLATRFQAAQGRDVLVVEIMSIASSR